MSRCSLVLVVVVVACGCGGGSTVESPPPAAPERIRLESPGFQAKGTIPERFTCSGKGTPPPLRWSGVPQAVRSLALVVTDPDAPGGTFVHWTAWDLPPHSRGVAGRLPAGAREGKNSSGDTGWTPPCPPGGDSPHRYVFSLYALSKSLGLESGAPPEDVFRALRSHATVRGRLTGRFGR